MANSETSIINQGLGLIGSLRINDFSDDSENSPQIIQARLHYEPTRDALIRSFRWRFAAGRSQLTQDTSDPDFEYDNQFVLPTDFAASRSVFGDNGLPMENTRESYSIEGLLLLTNESSIALRYTKLITDATKFDPLFVKVLALNLADDFIGPLAGGDKNIQAKIDRKLTVLMPKVRAMDRQETNTIGRNSKPSWNAARLTSGGRIDSQLGS